jgi:anti-sigma28 factor (negative regulator of flagellin synthesis)
MISKVNIGNVLANNYKISNEQNNKQEVQNKNLKSKEESKLESIKKSIENGSYKIDLDKTANKIADTLL